MKDELSIAALTRLSDDDLEDFLLCNDPKFIAFLERSRKQYKKSDCIPLEDLKKELGISTQRPRKKRD
jgi:hypothetical protein